ncbi:Vitamin K epoxide reductase [Streptomyces sp. NBC_01635]|uniref:vitamin K epoxide reductase family protein n=1 Tax=Streptomyces sp. NBC_01635 TaxID=2975904 RepID=UPI00386D8407|nr:Vitamin K epoxide reductase [Streptomyces sp. NBC_01635]
MSGQPPSSAPAPAAVRRPASGVRRPHTVGAGRRTGLVLLLTGLAGRLASFRLTVDDRRLLRNPAYRPPCDLSPVVSCGSVMSSPQGSLFGFPDMLLGLGAFAAVAALGVAAFTGGLWLTLGAGALARVVFVHWLIVQSLYELNKLCSYCAVVRVVTTALFWYVAVHCLDRGLVPAPRLVREVVRDTHGMLLGAWYALLAVLVLTRFWSYWSTLP